MIALYRKARLFFNCGWPPSIQCYYINICYVDTMKHSGLNILLFAILLSACSSSTDLQKPLSHASRDVTTERANIVMMLYNQFTHWQGTSYRYGGLSKKGIDCSGLVYLVYEDLFAIQLPRTTKQLRRHGRRVSFAHLLPGDLLFFKTGWFSDHVGIYLEDGNFFHASTSSGVRVSSLEESYWRQTFDMAKRVDIF